MSKECVLFLNKAAGALKLKPGPNMVEQRMAEVGLEADIIYPKSVADMRYRIAECVKQGVKKVVVAGGDGTVHQAVQELVHTDTALGVIPLGTANNFATALNLPMELTEALRTIKEGQLREVSVGKVGNEYFTEGAGVGLFADALALYGAGTNKNIFKGLYSIIRLLFSLPRSRIKVTLDGKVIVERAAMCTVANIFRIGSAYPIAPGAKVTDEVFDVVIVGDIRRRDLLFYYRALKAQVHTGLPKVRIEKAKTVTIESLNGLNVHCDDRIIGTTPVTITLEPRSLKVLTERI